MEKSSEELDARSAEFQGGYAEDAGPAAVIDQRAARQRHGVEHLQAQRGGRVGAGAECESRIETHYHGRGVCRGRRFRRAHPQAPSETHRLPVFEPHPFPVAAFDRPHACALGDVRSKHLRQAAEALRRLDRLIEQRAHERVAPQPYLIRLRLEHRLIAAVRERDRRCARREKRLLDRLRA